jgi:lysophospholipid acyltransferase (LPLAT)-like uncharacterized protein
VQNVARTSRSSSPVRARVASDASALKPRGFDVALARAVEPYLHWVARASTWSWTDASGRFVDGSVVDPRLVALGRRAQPFIFTYYIADALGVATLGLMHVEFRRLLRGVRCLVDDTLTGRVSGALIEHLGGRYALLPRADDPDRLRAVQTVIRGGGSCAFPVDGGGPYRRVGTGLIGLAESLRATIVPFAVHIAPAVAVAPQSRVRIPIWRGRAVAAMGDEIRVERRADRRAAAARVQNALDVLGVAVRHPF